MSLPNRLIPFANHFGHFRRHYPLRTKLAVAGRGICFMAVSKRTWWMATDTRGGWCVTRLPHTVTCTMLVWPFSFSGIYLGEIFLRAFAQRMIFCPNRRKKSAGGKHFSLDKVRREGWGGTADRAFVFRRAPGFFCSVRFFASGREAYGYLFVRARPDARPSTPAVVRVNRASIPGSPRRVGL